jgi:hypothetical protein
MASRQDSKQRDGMHVSNLYSAFLTATPLNTLSHNLRVGRSTEEHDDVKSSTDYVYFSNSAKIYRGVDLNLAIGQTLSFQETGQRIRSTTITGGSTLVPYRTMTINLYYSDVKSKTTGTDSQTPGTDQLPERHCKRFLHARRNTVPLRILFNIGDHL